MLVKDIMTRETRFVSKGATLREAAELMQGEDVGFLPVRDGGQLVGVVTDRDLAVRPVERKDASYDNLSVEDVMSPHAHAIKDTTPVAGAASAMKLKSVRRLLVLDDASQLVGVVSVGDIAARAEQKGLAADVLDHLASRSGPGAAVSSNGGA